MADQHDNQTSGRGFWGCANIFLATAFAAFAGIAGIALIAGGLSTHPGEDAQSEIKGAAAGSASAPAGAAAPALSPAGAAPAQPGAGAPAPAPAPSGSGGAAAPPSSGDTVEVTIKPGLANPMSYDVTTINVRAGQKVKITFHNQHPTAPLQHSLLVCKPGSRDRMYAVSDAMMTDMPKWLAKGFIPETPDVLHHTKLLNPGES